MVRNGQGTKFGEDYNPCQKNAKKNSSRHQWSQFNYTSQCLLREFSKSPYSCGVFFTWVCPGAADLMTTSSRSKTPSSWLSLSLYPNPQTLKTETQQALHPFFPQHTPTKKFKIFFFFYLLSFSLFRCPQNPDVRLSVRPSVPFCLSLLLPFNSKFNSKKNPGFLTQIGLTRN